MSEGFPACSKGKSAAPKKTGLLCSEPFRLFFPAGLLASVIGVSLWPLFYAGAIGFAPHVPHARLMIEGFFGAFILGFMGTALPRMLGAPRLVKGELVALFCLYAGAVLSHSFGRVAWGDGFFLTGLLFFLVVMGARLFFLRRDLPPPGFALAVMGILGAVAGIVILLAGQVVTLPVTQQRFAGLLLNEGFVLFPILGVGGFLFPRVLGLVNKEDLPESTKVTRAWGVRAAIAAGCGLVLLLGYGVEASGWVREARILRALAIGIYLVSVLGVFRRSRAKGTLGTSLRVAIVMVPVGLLAVGLYPQFQKGFDHLVFVSGFGLIALCVASRVILGHADRIELATGRSRVMRWVLGLVLLAAATRAIADPLPHIAVTHHIYAAILWISVAAVWGGWLFPKWRR